MEEHRGLNPDKTLTDFLGNLRNGVRLNLVEERRDIERRVLDVPNAMAFCIFLQKGSAFFLFGVLAVCSNEDELSACVLF